MPNLSRHSVLRNLSFFEILLRKNATIGTCAAMISSNLWLKVSEESEFFLCEQDFEYSKRCPSSSRWAMEDNCNISFPKCLGDCFVI